MTDVDPVNALSRWMQSQDGRRTIATVAEWLAKKIAVKKIPLSVIDLPGGAPPEEITAQIQSELNLYILENSGTMADRLFAPEAQPESDLYLFMFSRFMDRARTTRHDPWRYLYKQASDALRACPDIHTKSKGGMGTVYSLVSPSVAIGPLSPEDIRGVALPADFTRGITLKQVSPRKALVALAEHFWAAVSRINDQRPVWVELRTLIDWIGFFVPLHPFAPESLDAAVVPGGQCPEEIFSPKRIRCWARILVSRMGAQQLAAYYHHYCRRLTLREAAARMNLKSASNVDYHLNQFAIKLQSFVADLPWLSADGGEAADETARSYFAQVLCGLLEKQRAKP